MAQAGAARVPRSEEIAQLVGRIERLPLTGLQVRARVIIGTATFFDAFDALALSYIMPVLIPLWKINPLDVGTLIAVGYIGQLIGALLFGWVAEKWGRMPSMLLSIATFSIFSVLCMFSTSYGMLFVLRTIQGMGLGGEVPVAASYISEISKAKGRGTFVLAYEMAFNLGLFIVAIIGRLIVPAIGWQGMFLVGAIPAIAIIFMRMSLPESPRWLANRGRIEEADKVVTRLEKEASKNGTVELPPVVVKPAVPVQKTRVGELFEGIYRRRTFTVWVLWFTAYFATYGMQTWMPTLYSTVFKLPLDQALTYPLITQGAGFIGGLICVFLIDRTGRKPWFIMSFFLGGIFLVALWATGATTVTLVVIFAALSQFFFATIALALYLYNPEIYPTRMRALGGSIGTGWLRIASAIGPFAMGWLLPVSGIAGAFLMFGLVLIVGGIVTALFAVETKNRVLEEVSP